MSIIWSHRVFKHFLKTVILSISLAFKIVLQKNFHGLSYTVIRVVYS